MDDNAKDLPRPTHPTDSDRQAMLRYRVCLMVSIPVYLGLAAILARWLPDFRVISLILTIFAGHSAAYLLTHFMRGDAAGPNHPDV